MNFEVGQRVEVTLLDHTREEDLDNLGPPTKPWAPLTIRGEVVWADEHYIQLELEEALADGLPTVRWAIVRGAIIQTKKLRRRKQ